MARVYLGSKRGVMRGVDPTNKEQSIMFLAGVTSGFLLDLQRANISDHGIRGSRWYQTVHRCLTDRHAGIQSNNVESLDTKKGLTF